MTAAGGGGHDVLHGEVDGYLLDVTLDAAKPAVLQHGDGYTDYDFGGNTYYYSRERMTASGTIAIGTGPAVPVTGVGWFDHQYGDLDTAIDTGWDWFALQLDDGTDVMLYRMRGADGYATPFSSGTLVPAKGAPTPIRWADVRLTETRRWRSPRSGATYPAGWRIAMPSMSFDVEVTPLLADQELDTAASTGVVYWEGACSVRGTRAGRPITGRAYVEMTGYAGRDVPGLAETRLNRLLPFPGARPLNALLTRRPR
jgi:predicted secreted hydrolase